MMNSLVSVIVPVYNVEEYLPKCIDSIINQTYPHLEIILVDDGSTDKSGIICDEYNVIDNRIKVIHKVNGGVSTARNIGIDESTGDYVSFIDSDDTVDETYIEELVKAACKYDFDLVICNIRDIYSENISEKRCIGNNLTGVFFEDYYKLIEVLRVPVVKLYKSDIIKGNNIFFKNNIKFSEDQIFNFEYYQYTTSYTFVDKSLYNYYHRNNNSLSQVTTLNTYSDFLEKLNIEKEFLKKYNIKNANLILNNHALGFISQFVVLDDINDNYFLFKKRLKTVSKFIDVFQKSNSLKRRIVLMLLKKRSYMPIYLYYLLKKRAKRK